MSGPSSDPSLSAERIEALLDDILWSQGASKRAAALSLAGLPRAQQDFVLGWVRTLEKDNIACANQLLANAHRALGVLDLDRMEDWILRALDIYDHSGLYAALEVFRHPERFLEQARLAAVGLTLDQVSGILQRFVLGLSGRPLKLEAGERTYTDTENLYLPASASRFDRREDNFRLLKASAAYLWAQTRFGTWRPATLEVLGRHGDSPRALALFETLEGLRLHARIARELPGLYRDMGHLNALTGQAPGADWDPWRMHLEQPGSTAQDSLDLLGPLLENGPPIPAPLCYQGCMCPERVAEILALRLAEERSGLRSLLVRYRAELEADQPAPAPEASRADAATPFAARLEPDPEHPGEWQLELSFHDRPVAPPEEVRRLLDSILLDLGEIPPDYLVPAGDGHYRPRHQALEAEDASADVWSGTYHERGAYLYNEWDFRRQNYRKHWCVLRELTLEPRSEGFVERTLERHARHLDRLRKTFEALRGEDRWLKKEPYGDAVDIDALVEAHGDARRGLEMSERLFRRRDKVERNIAVLFMVDMSGSTRGWVNDAEREALILLCEALESLGDRYAIYGFSGMTRKRCETYRVKAFEEAYGERVRGRIEAIEPRDYTRMGVAIRHLSGLLNQVEARTRVLITLSDGKPDDYSDEYRGEYGIEDTRQALIEAKRTGIHPFCITIDRQAQDYLPHMYGAVNYTILDAVEQLPYRVSEIYRRLTR